MNEMQNIRELCERFVAAIFSIPPENRPHGFQCFPQGCCGTSTELIGTFLFQNGHGHFDYVIGNHERLGNHAWAQRGDIIVDITSGQFLEQPPIIVSNTSSWHDAFEVTDRFRIDLHKSDKNAAIKISPFYEMVVSKLKT